MATPIALTALYKVLTVAQPGVLLARDRTPARKRAYDAQYVPCHTDLYKGERGKVSNT